MKLRKLGLAVLLTIFLSACEQMNTTTPMGTGEITLESAFDSVSYAMGISFGYNISQMGMDTIAGNAFFSGLMSALRSENTLIDMETANVIVSEHLAVVQRSKGEANTAKSKKWLEENARQEGVIELPSGLQYKVIKEGTGPKPTLNDNVKVHYVGKLIDGSTFDSSRERGVPAEFGLKGVIRAWTEGLQLMSEGSTYMLYAPPELAYGTEGGPGGGGSVLIFEVELLEVIKSEM